MSAFIAAATPYLEFLRLLASLALAVGVFIAYAQLKHVRRDYSARMERAAKEKAIEASEKYLGEVVTLSNAFFSHRKENSIPEYSGPVGDFSKSSLEKPNIDELKRICWEGIAPLNKLETVAAMFISRVADERTGYRIIGRSFCDTVKFQYDIIVRSKVTEDAQPYWYNIIELYKIWSPRIQVEELSSDARKIHESLKNLAVSDALPPLGSEKL
ncbi:MAG: hypothetical protein V4574_04355 [Pseudomonadota bacterium]